MLLAVDVLAKLRVPRMRLPMVLNLEWVGKYGHVESIELHHVDWLWKGGAHRLVGVLACSYVPIKEFASCGEETKHKCCLKANTYVNNATTVSA